MSVQENIAANLRRLRSAARLSQTQLAEKADLSRYAIAKLEKGEVMPQASTLQKLADALDASLSDLVEEVQELHHVRFRAKQGMYGRDQILADVSRWLRDFRELEEILGDYREFHLGERCREDRMDPKAAAKCAREFMGLGDEPVRDICGLLEHHGIKVKALPKNTDAFFGLSISEADGGPAIVVNTWEKISVERWIFSAAHELGHLLLHLGAFDVSRTDEEREQEREADQFASYFLMPAEAFRSEWNDARGLSLIDRVFKVKRIFRVSYLTVLYRLVEEGKADASIWPKFKKIYSNRTGKKLRKADEPQQLGADDFYSGAPVRKKSAEPKRLDEADFREDRLSDLVRRAFEQGEVSLGRAGEILGHDLKDMRELVGEWVV